jgi:hypothetical protein
MEIQWIFVGISKKIFPHIHTAVTKLTKLWFGERDRRAHPIVSIYRLLFSSTEEMSQNAFAKALWKPFLMVLLAVVSVEVLLILSATPNVDYTLSFGSSPAGAELNQFSSQNMNPFSRQLSSSNNSNNNDKGDKEFVYNNPLDTYSPSQFVIYGHKFTGMDFALNMEYGQRLLYAPIVTCGLGFIAIFLTHFGLLCRCCFDCCRCLPDTESVHYDRDRLCLTIFYIVLCLLVLIIDQLVFLGNQSIDDGIVLIKDDVKTLNNLLKLIVDDSGSLYDYAATLSTQYTAVRSNCTSFPANLKQPIDSFSSDMKSLKNSLGTVTDQIDMLDGYIDQYAIFYRNIGLYVVWGLAIGSVIFFAIAKFIESMCFTKWSIFFATITYTLFLILGIPWLLITSSGGDLCMAPTYNLIKNIPMEMIQNITLYYATCQGYSALNTYVDSGFGSVKNLNATVTAYLNPNNPGNCHTSVALKEMHGTIYNGVFPTIDDINLQMGCAPINYLWFDILNNGICTDFYQGVFYIWGSQLVTSFLMFCLIVISAILYQYYDSGKIVPDKDDEDEEDEEVGHAVVEEYNDDIKKEKMAHHHHGDGDHHKHKVKKHKHDEDEEVNL